jgi:hypothetical protein
METFRSEESYYIEHTSIRGGETQEGMLYEYASVLSAATSNSILINSCQYWTPIITKHVKCVVFPHESCVFGFSRRTVVSFLFTPAF